MKRKPASEFLKISTIDAHTAGEPLRVITDGLPEIPGKTMLEKRRYAQNNLDAIRRSLMFEPRGHSDMYGAIVTEPVTDDGDLGVLFMHNEGWSTMCGHGVIALVTIALETGMLSSRMKSKIINLDTPAGRVRAQAFMRGDRVGKVTFENVLSFVYSQDDTIDIPNLGEVSYDIAFGGAFYTFVKASDLKIAILPENVRTLIDYGIAIKQAVANSREIRHPFERDLSFLYGTIISSPAMTTDAHTRNVCVFAEGEVDRSPTGTGVSARLAIEYLHGRIHQKEDYIVESILGTRFIGQVIQTAMFGDYEAIVPSVTGNAWITGRHQFLIHSEDPLKDGFLLR